VQNPGDTSDNYEVLYLPRRRLSFFHAVQQEQLFDVRSDFSEPKASPKLPALRILGTQPGSEFNNATPTASSPPTVLTDNPADADAMKAAASSRASPWQVPEPDRCRSREWRSCMMARNPPRPGAL
jgi:hypothetical protein